MTTQIKIDGMSCGHCVAGVKKALEAVPGVESAEVSLTSGHAVVRGTAEVSALVEAVEEEGYRAAPVSMETDSGGTASGACLRRSTGEAGEEE